MAPELAERAQTAWQSAKESHRIGLSDFSHGRQWKEELKQAGVMEIVDHNNTCAWLISHECMDAMMERMEMLEDLVDEAQMRAIIAERAPHAHFMHGEEAAKLAMDYFEERYGDALELRRSNGR